MSHAYRAFRRNVLEEALTMRRAMHKGWRLHRPYHCNGAGGKTYVKYYQRLMQAGRKNRHLPYYDFVDFLQSYNR